jgi:anti-anti-sigma regulatory factor
MSSFRSGRLDVQVKGARAVLAGRIDDSCQLAEISDQLSPGEVVIDTAGVTFVNSIGMREWGRFIRALRARGSVTLEAVADVLMAQMNLITEFRSGVRITSFHASYVCPACGYEASLLIDAVAHAERLRQLQAPALPCPECRAAMGLADFPERYLSLFRA